MALTIPVESIEITDLRAGQAHLGAGNTVAACIFDARRGGTTFNGMKAYIDEGRFVVVAGEAQGARKIAQALQDDPGFHERVASFLSFGSPFSTPEHGIQAT